MACRGYCGTVREVDVMGVRVEMPSNQPIVLLREVSGERYLPIWIGAVEATAIAFAQQGVVPPRPLTHDLMKNLLEAMGQELTEVLDISRQALADVRSVALSYRELSLNEETQSAQALLCAADIEVTVRIDACDELPTDVRVTLATVLREGVTNLLRHSKAERCEIVLSSSPRLVTMDIINDGLAATDRNSRKGSGIGNLTTRVCALGGSLDAGPTSERTFRLHAEIPLA